MEDTNNNLCIMSAAILAPGGKRFRAGDVGQKYYRTLKIFQKTCPGFDLLAVRFRKVNRDSPGF